VQSGLISASSKVFIIFKFVQTITQFSQYGDTLEIWLHVEMKNINKITPFLSEPDLLLSVNWYTQNPWQLDVKGAYIIAR
jgi:hypothetical protein